MAQNPTESIFSAIGIMSSVLILVARRDWCPSLNVLSWILMGFLGPVSKRLSILNLLLFDLTL
jgi:hypothetical protein